MTSDKIIKGLVKSLHNYRLGFLFLAPLGKRRVVIVIVSIKENKIGDDKKAIKLDKGVFDTSSIYNVGSFVLMIVLAFLYAFFW